MKFGKKIMKVRISYRIKITQVSNNFHHYSAHARTQYKSSQAQIHYKPPTRPPHTTQDSRIHDAYEEIRVVRVGWMESVG